ncbi:zinc finger protein 570 [Anopheles gambiae]|uniref:zinc finger protein 570 n=1 Tax=Anopheles gambiae TaxID=7165 RepID=UPI002AC8CD3D|nr:zinc finger protein 570 [Anopheles gambiae]
MLSVCRLCARWGEPFAEMDTILVENLQPNKAIMRMFGFDLSCSPSYPNQVCHECVQSLEYSFVFHQQLVNAETLLRTLLEKGQLEQRLLEKKEVGESLQPAVELLEVIPLSDMPQHSEAGYADPHEPKKTVESLSDGGESLPEENGWPDKSAEKVIEIKIEAIEELEIISSPLEAGETSGVPSQGATHTCDDEESLFLHRKNSGEAALELSNESNRISNAEQKAIRAIVPNKCYVCYKVYANEAELTAHLIEHNELLPFRCRQCSTTDRVFEYRTIRALNKHLESHRYPFDCGECRLRFRKITARNDHFLRMHMSEGVYTCERCGVEFQDARKFRLHMAAHRNMELQRYKCPVCSKAFQSSTLLERHKQIHAAKPLFQCQHCMRGFNSKSNYMQHKMLHLQQNALIHCGETGCRQNFTNYRDWRRHMKAHYPQEAVYWECRDMLPVTLHDTTGYPQPCPEAGCTYVAASLPLMFAHYRVHYKAFRCEQCDGRYSNASALRQHVEIRHEGVRRFECDRCGKRFAYRHKLREHVAVHLGVRSFKCKQCPRKFTSSSNLAAHGSTHASEQAANSSRRCALCATTFVSAAALAHHHQEYQRLGQSGASACERIQARRQEEEGLLRQREMESSSD